MDWVVTQLQILIASTSIYFFNLITIQGKCIYYYCNYSYNKHKIENDKNDSTIAIIKGNKQKRIWSKGNNINKYNWIDSMYKMSEKF